MSDSELAFALQERIEELEKGRDIQRGNAKRWEELALQYKRDNERLRVLIARIRDWYYGEELASGELEKLLAAAEERDNED